MKITDSIAYLLFVGIFFISIDHTQQLTSNNNKNGNRFPSYSLQNMPKTDFSCRGKILGGYYADADTQCQMFHICVKIAGVGVQDFRFLCPNGTAFDQEAQTCADFGDVDCEQATLFYGSDNFDLYRIGSGFDSAKRPTPAAEDESTFHLQRAESNDIRRSKQPIGVQNTLYNLGSSFNQPQQQQHQQHQNDLTSLKPANQYQPQKVTTTTSRSSLITRKSTTSTATPHVTVKPTPIVLASSNSNNNDEIFKGSHSSNFYSNRNSNDDDDDYKSRSFANTVKSRHRSRGRTQYRGTPATTTSTTFKPPVVQNYTNFGMFTTRPTTPSPFKFTFSSTIRSNPALSNVVNQINSTPLGPLQQQYQQPNYNNNFINFKVPTTTAAPVPTTLRSNFRANSFSSVTTQPTFNLPLRQIVSSPTPFNSNHLNGNNANAKPITNTAPFTNTNNFNNNLQNSNSSNFSRHRTFDNHNTINNYQTTSPFSNQRTVENHLPPNNTVLRLAPTQANHYFPQNSAANVQRNNSFYQPIVITTQRPPATTLSPIVRNSLSPERPNFGQQDLLNQFNADQRKSNQQKPASVPAVIPAPINNPPSVRRPEQAQNYRVQLHYDINDYLTTDKHTSQSYSPTSEQYRSVQTYSTSQASSSNQFFTTKYYDPVFSTTPKINKQPLVSNNHYQTQQDRPSQAVNAPFNYNSKINTTQPVPKQPLNNNNNLNNNIVSTSTKKFSTLVPKENYAPTTFKPLFYFNVAKQINDHLSTPAKFKAATDTIALSTTSTTSRTVSITPIYNRGADFAQFNVRESPANKPQAQFQVAKSLNVTEIDENDGQYHPELYEKDFARYKIKNRKKQQLQNFQKPNFVKAQNDFGIGNKYQTTTNRGTQKSFGTSIEEEFLNTAHSQNIAASGNELWNAKHAAKLKPTQNVVAKAPEKATTSPPIVTTKAPSTPKDDKDASYDYAYYDSGNDTPHDYSDLDLDFTKTRKQ